MKRTGRRPQQSDEKNPGRARGDQGQPKTTGTLTCCRTCLPKSNAEEPCPEPARRDRRSRQCPGRENHARKIQDRSHPRSPADRPLRRGRSMPPTTALGVAAARPSAATIHECRGYHDQERKPGTSVAARSGRPIASQYRKSPLEENNSSPPVTPGGKRRPRRTSSSASPRSLDTSARSTRRARPRTTRHAQKVGPAQEREIAESDVDECSVLTAGPLVLARTKTNRSYSPANDKWAAGSS